MVDARMTPFRRRWFENDGDIRCYFWSGALIAKRLGRGCDSAGRRLFKCRIGCLL